VLRIAWVGDAFTCAEQYTEHQQQRKAGNEAGNNGRERAERESGRQYVTHAIALCQPSRHGLRWSVGPEKR
jgi:hypothetical protein